MTEQNELSKHIFEMISERYQKHLNYVGRAWDKETRAFVNGLRDDIEKEVKAQLAKLQKPRPEKIEGWADDITDRIEYFEDKTVDEAVMVGANVHLESLSESSIMLIIDNGKHHWHFSIFSRSGRAKVDITLMEGYNV